MKDDTLVSSTVGKKIIMSVSGLVLFIYVVLHMLGNLQVFIDRETMDKYAAFLHYGLDGQMEKALWLVRIVLLGAILAHVYFAISLYAQSKRARKQGYAKRQWMKASVSSRSMIYGGLFLGLFIVFHLLHFTIGAVGFGDTALAFGNHMQFGASEAYRNVYTSFMSPMIAGIYILAMVFLGLHLYHGSWSMFQTLGVNHPRFKRMLQVSMRITGVAIAFGFALIPLLIVTGIAQPRDLHPHELPPGHERYEAPPAHEIDDDASSMGHDNQVVVYDA